MFSAYVNKYCNLTVQAYFETSIPAGQNVSLLYLIDIYSHNYNLLSGSCQEMLINYLPACHTVCKVHLFPKTYLMQLNTFPNHPNYMWPIKLFL